MASCDCLSMNTTGAPRIAGMEDFLSRSTATIAVETSIMLLIGLIAIGGNLLVIISIYRNPSLRTITNYFVLSLAFTDILFPVMGLPPSLVWSIKSRYTLPNICSFQAVLTTALSYVSIFMIVLMAVNRFVCVCKPLKYQQLFNSIKSISMIGFVWITSFTLVTLSEMAGEEIFFPRFLPRELRCSLVYNLQNTFAKAVGNTLLVVGLFIPLSIILYCYYKVFKKIREHKRNIAPASNPNSLGTSVQEIKVTWTMFAVLLGFCLTWIPVIVIMVTKNLCDRYKCVLPPQVHMIISCAGISSSAVNPIIYGAMNSAFRREYTKILQCRV